MRSEKPATGQKAECGEEDGGGRERPRPRGLRNVLREESKGI